ncbi:MAG TPA: alpha-L-arabinofuranosidase C-terminal domain-containing protein [Hyalangium sp.]|nr:alpha-L-arabinofuranosidase C-terminal domain-containing protein [Hyalangium sp.]
MKKTRFIGALLCAAWSCMASAQSPVPASSQITIDATQAQGPVSRYLHGQFIEYMFQGIKEGLDAELIRNRSFEGTADEIGITRSWWRDPDTRNDDFRIRFKQSTEHHGPPLTDSDPPVDRKLNGHSLQVVITEDDGQRHGIHQRDLPVDRSKTYKGYVWLKADDFEGQVTIALESAIVGGPSYASYKISGLSQEWRKYEFTLQPRASDPLAQISILFSGQGTLWVDQVSLQPGDAVDGVRRDVFEKLRALKPSFLRWPGGNVAQDYHWKWGVGPRDQRVNWVNKSWDNEFEPSEFGTHEYIQLCRNLGAEPTITLNVEGDGATVQEAVEWVEYVNGPASSPQGARRASHGHPQPYGVKYWEIGNEIWGHWVRGHSDAETYARNYNRYVEAIRKVDPNALFIAVGDNDMEWNRTVLKIAGRNIDLLSVHHYWAFPKELRADADHALARPVSYEKFYGELEKEIARLVPGRKIKLAINEWNTQMPLPAQHSLEAGLAGARLLNVLERKSHFVEMGTVSDAVNGWPGGLIQASRHGLFVTPVYQVHALYVERTGTELLATETRSETFDSASQGQGIPLLDAVASRAKDKIFVKIVNTDRTRDHRVKLDIKGVKLKPGATFEWIGAERIDTYNSWQTPNAIAIRKKTIPFSVGQSILVPRHSVAVVTLTSAP